MTDLALFECPDPRPPWDRERLRPPRYVAVSRIELDNSFWEHCEPMAKDDDEEYGYYALYQDEPDDGFEEDAVWDNWFGGWVVEQPWVDDLDLVTEGHARYDLRPLETA